MWCYRYHLHSKWNFARISLMKIISITPYSVRSFLTPPLWWRNSRTKIQVFSGIANERGNLGLHLLTYVFFICNIQCSFALRFAPNCVVSSFAPFTGSLLVDSLLTSKVAHSSNLLESLFINAFLGQVYLSTEQLPMKAKFQSGHILTFHHL